MTGLVNRFCIMLVLGFGGRGLCDNCPSHA